MVLAILGLFLTACGGDSSSSSDGGTKGDTESKATKSAAKSKKTGDNSVSIHESAEPDQINPIISSSANSTYIESNIFQTLLRINPATLELEGVLAAKRPDIQELDNGGMSLAFEIRPEATWDNGTPITADDYIFTIKAIKNPKVNAGSIRPYMESIERIEKDPANPKKFTVYLSEKYILAESNTGYYVYPEYVYDPNKIMRNFTIEQLNSGKSSSDKRLQEFATQFNDPKHAREVGGVIGSGPYEFKGWETGQRVVLERKKDWWGDKVDFPALNAKPDKIIYKIIKDRTTAVTSMKDEGLDVVRDINPNLFIDLQKNEGVKAHYNLHTPTFLAYYYIGLNRKSPKLADQKVRRAIAHLVDVEEIIDVTMHGLAERTIGPIHPSKSAYNRSITPIPFDVAKAKELLTEAGWTDSDGNGVVDKMIDGKKMDMKLSYKYNSDNDFRKEIGLLLKENAKRAGVDIEVEGLEWTVFLEDTKKRDYDMASLAWISAPTPDDLKQIWHSEADNPDGDNRVGFGSEESDKLIEEIRFTLDEGKRNEMYKKVQQMIHDDQPYIFMFTPKERIGIHNRFDNADTYVARPGYDEKQFVLKP